MNTVEYRVLLYRLIILHIRESGIHTALCSLETLCFLTDGKKTALFAPQKKRKEKSGVYK